MGFVPLSEMVTHMQKHTQVPVNLLRASRIFTFEPPPGVKANLVRTFSTVPAPRMCREPHERARLYFLLAWFHATIQERLRYAPLGWTKKYEFNESDLRMACDTLDTWLDSVAQVLYSTWGQLICKDDYVYSKFYLAIL